MNNHSIRLCAIAAFAFALSACSAEASAGSQPNAAATGDSPPATLTADTRRHITSVLAAYERVRAALGPST